MRVSCDWVLANSSHVFNLLCLFVVVVVIFYVISPTVSTHPRSQEMRARPRSGHSPRDTAQYTRTVYYCGHHSGICSPFFKWLLLA